MGKKRFEFSLDAMHYVNCYNPEFVKLKGTVDCSICGSMIPEKSQGVLTYLTEDGGSEFSPVFQLVRVREWVCPVCAEKLLSLMEEFDC